MGPNINSSTIAQPTNKHCCCNGRYCKSSYDIDSQNRFAAMREDFDRLNKNIFDDFTINFPVVGGFDSNIIPSPQRCGVNWDLGSNLFQNASHADQVKVNNEKDRLEMVFDTTGFEKEDLKVNRKGKIITVEGRHAKKSSDESKYVSKQFSRSYTLPSDCNMEKMKSILSNNKLSITVPRNTPEHDTLTVRQVPIDCSDKKDFSFSKKSTTSNTVAEEGRKSECFAKENSIICSNPIRNVPISVEKQHIITPEETIKECSNEKTKLHECENKMQCQQQPPRWIRPILLFNKDDSIFHTNMLSKLNDRWNNMVQDQQKNKTFTREIEVNQNDSKELNLTFDLKDYKPDELKVTVMDNVLKIEAKHEDSSDGNHVSRHFVRSYVLPDDYKVREVQSSLSKSGKLVVTVPKQNITEKTDAQNIPIKMI